MGQRHLGMLDRAIAGKLVMRTATQTAWAAESLMEKAETLMEKAERRKEKAEIRKEKAEMRKKKEKARWTARSNTSDTTGPKIPRAP
jgi:hypothetical protein